jgi:uncharacterized membrane protein YcaP (DUF421 family)
MDIDKLLGLSSYDLEWYQMVLRAVVVFTIALIFIRTAGMRSFGTQSAFDVVFNITTGAVLSRCITGHYPFLPCLLAALTLALLHRLVAFLAFHFKTIHKLAEGDAIPLYKDGVSQEKNLAKNLIHEKEVERALREQNQDSLKDVKSIWYESDGKISVVKKE